MLYLATLIARSQEPAESLPLVGTAGPDLTRYFVVCSLLVVLVAGLAFVLKRTVGRGLLERASKRSLRVVDALPLGGRKRMAVVQCYDRTFLLGCGDREISVIAELDADGVLNPAPPAQDVPPPEHPRTPERQVAQTTPEAVFRNVLRQATSNSKTGASSNPSFQPQKLAELMREKGILG